MFSKEWKLVVLSLLSTVMLTACPNHKKKNPEASNKFKGLWVNSETARNLNGQVLGEPGMMQPLCHAIASRLDAMGIEETFMGEVLLDAWAIHGNGDVYRYSAYQNSVSHGYRNAKYFSGRIGGTTYNRDTRQGGANFTAYNYSSPFSLGTGILTLEGNALYVSANGAFGYNGGPSYVSYTRVTNDQLIAMTNIVQACKPLLNLRGRWHGNRMAPGPATLGVPTPGVIPGQGPQVVIPQGQVPPAHFEQLPMK